jgi:hypothetical protein
MGALPLQGCINTVDQFAMSEQSSDKIGRWMVALAVMAFVSLGYFYFVAYRLDWVRYITESYYWRVESLACPGKLPEAVVVLSEAQNAKPKHVLSDDPELARYLNTLHPDQPVKVEIRRKGYLWEFNYGEQFVLSIGSKGIYDAWRKLPQDLENCTYGPPVKVDPTLLPETRGKTAQQNPP